GTERTRFRSGPALGMEAHRAWTELRRLAKEREAPEATGGWELLLCGSAGAASDSISMVCSDRPEGIFELNGRFGECDRGLLATAPGEKSRVALGMLSEPAAVAFGSFG